jgi:hypothetical protein
MVGSVRNIPVYVSPLIGGTEGSSYSCLAHREALVHAETPLEMEDNYIPEQFAYLFSAFMTYGVAENRDLGGIWIKCAS